MRVWFSFLLMFMLWGCFDGDRKSIADLKKPQDAMLYVQEGAEKEQSLQSLESLKKDYLAKFFAPFLLLSPNPNLDEVFWIKTSLQKHLGFGENLKPNQKEEALAILQRMQIENYPNAMLKAIITKDTNVRAVPSLKPRFSKANGYPFDRWQNSLIFYGTPVLITQFDTSKRFAHIQTEFVYGWVEVADLAIVSDEQAREITKMQDFVMPNNDSILIDDKEGKFVTQARIGKLFILDKQHQMLIFKRTSSGRLKIEKIKISLEDFHSFPQLFSQKSVAGYINQLLGQKYGWGGMYENRDCSAFVRDIFGNFGLYLPRNSYAQAKYGTHQIKVEGLSLKQKEEMILQNATPFSTILWLKGHIMLYIGKDKEGNPMVAHDAWSVQTSDIFAKREYKLGGIVITTLKPANEHNGFFIKSKTLGDRVKMMNVLYPKLQGEEF